MYSFLWIFSMTIMLMSSIKWCQKWLDSSELLVKFCIQNNLLFCDDYYMNIHWWSSHRIKSYCTCVLFIQVYNNKSIGPSQELVAVFRRMESKLLAIPVVFVLLRIWSLVITELSVDGSLNLPCKVIMILLVVAVGYI